MTERSDNFGEINLNYSSGKRMIRQLSILFSVEMAPVFPNKMEPFY